MEIVITGVIVVLAGLIIYRSIKSSSKGICNCGDCSKKCPSRKR
jgi:hypothetical protein